MRRSRRYRPPDPDLEDLEESDEFELDVDRPGRGKWFAISFIVDLAVFFFLFNVVDTSWIVAFLISELVGWTVRAFGYWKLKRGR